jgi:pimeloyl-ACP methyl ester carboxylesterase
MSTSNGSQSPDTILFIHGLWMTPRSWENWAARYESRGYKTLAPSWPGLEGEVEALNQDSTPLTKLDVPKIVDDYERIIRGLDSPPIIIGHSLGGTIMQLLIDRGRGAAGIGVSPGTVKGIRDLPLSTLKSSMPVLGNPFNRGNATPLNAKQFHYAFGNTLSREESDKIYQRYHVPAANRVLFQVAFSNLTPGTAVKVDFGRANRAPMLFIAAADDHVVPAKVVRKNALKYKGVPVDFKEFAGRPHFPGGPGWEEVADYALNWATEHTATDASRASEARTESVKASR